MKLSKNLGTQQKKQGFWRFQHTNFKNHHDIQPPNSIPVDGKKKSSVHQLLQLVVYHNLSPVQLLQRLYDSIISRWFISDF